VVSRRKRSNSSVGNKLNNLTDKVTEQQKLQQVSGTQTNAVTNDSIALGAVNTESVVDRSITGNKIGRGEVTSDNLGVINEIVASGGLDIETGVNGHLSLSGGKYEEPYDGIESSSGYKIVAFDPTDNAVKIIDNPPVINLDDMDDVRVSGAADKQILSYDTGTTDWVPVDATLDYLSDVTVASASAGETLLYNSSGVWVNSVPVSPNYIINGAFDIWQRSTSSSAAGYKTADRWYQNAGSSTTFSRESTVVPTDATYAFKMFTNAITNPYVEQYIGTSNAQMLAGKTVTFSAYLASSVSVTTALQLYYSTSVDAGSGGTWVSCTLVSGGSVTSTSTTYVRGSAVYTIPSNAKSLKASIVTQPTVASGVSIYVANVQLQEGSIATVFRRHSTGIQGELAACQRYYQKITAKQAYSLFASGVYNTATNCYMPIFLPVELRTTPAVSYSGAFRTLTGGSETVSNISIYTYSSTNPVSLEIKTSSTTDGNAAVLSANNDIAAYIEFDAEL
jgi:hypothetical protein